MGRIVKSGAGWRLGLNPKAEKFQGLVAGDEWSIELTEKELEDFCRLLDQLNKAINQISDELMDQERIVCEAESDLLWMQVEGFPESYTVKFILNQGRRGEGKWPVQAVPGLVQAAQMLKVF
ncbi:MAG: DUF1818 family protein [Okeania sp. SIO2D1]|uniref:DUF1818 family protein n=1 Tax=Okeania sp. SIO2C9 TaxID=2607791 RepID=UPI0013BD6C30|nr:DUF1818 family protein [Okeania sp. SIO2C9]NEQ75900.1 DUF1818 family protein [Okeania sp. SIO2C9]NES73533.1 DUF1818 family protein [Okeania sp. SIO2D1]